MPPSFAESIAWLFAQNPPAAPAAGGGGDLGASPLSLGLYALVFILWFYFLLILAVINFEVPSAKDTSLLGLAHSNLALLDMALRGSGLGQIYPLYAGLDLVPLLFGGIIPTDIQGIYRSGVPTASTAVDSPYYHTTADTPDKVDVPLLADTVDAFDRAIDTLLAGDPPSFVQPC